jgi:hypothetical protein
MSRYVFIVFVSYPVHVLQQDVMSLVLRLTRIVAAKGHLIDIAESQWTVGKMLINIVHLQLPGGLPSNKWV